MAFLPNLIGAVFVFVIGALFAKVFRQLIETALGAVPLDKWLGQLGDASKLATDTPLPGTGVPVETLVPQGHPQAQPHAQQFDPAQVAPGHPQQGYAQPTPAAPRNKVAHILATVVYAMIMIVVTISALQILGISAISVPASQMLTSIFDSIPRIIAALLLLGLGVLIAKFAGDLLGQVLEGVGADKAVASSGLLPEGTNVVSIASRVAQVAIVLFFAVMAAQALAFPQVTQILQQVLTLGGQVIFGGVIIAAGFFLGNLIQRLMNGGVAANVVKWVAIVLFVAMGLKAMGIADSIIELAFGAVVVGGAQAAALAFGLGGREAASRTLDKLEKKSEELAHEASTAAASAPTDES